MWSGEAFNNASSFFFGGIFGEGIPEVLPHRWTLCAVTNYFVAQDTGRFGLAAGHWPSNHNNRTLLHLHHGATQHSASLTKHNILLCSSSEQARSPYQLFARQKTCTTLQILQYNTYCWLQTPIQHRQPMFRFDKSHCGPAFY